MIIIGVVIGMFMLPFTCTANVTHHATVIQCDVAWPGVQSIKWAICIRGIYYSGSDWAGYIRLYDQLIHRCCIYDGTHYCIYGEVMLVIIADSANLVKPWPWLRVILSRSVLKFSWNQRSIIIIMIIIVVIMVHNNINNTW